VQSRKRAQPLGSAPFDNTVLASAILLTPVRLPALDFTAPRRNLIAVTPNQTAAITETQSASRRHQYPRLCSRRLSSGFTQPNFRFAA
jgi:hypothetical protein